MIIKNVEKVKKMITDYRQFTAKNVSDDAGILIGSCHVIFLNVFGMKQVTVKSIPQFLNFNKYFVEWELKNEVSNDRQLLKYVITGDET